MSTQPPILSGAGMSSSFKVKADVWLTGAVVCLHAALKVQLSTSVGTEWLHNALQYRLLMPTSCHLLDYTELPAMSQLWPVCRPQSLLQALRLLLYAQPTELDSRFYTNDMATA